MTIKGEKAFDIMQITQVSKTGFDHRIDLISEAKFRVNQCIHIVNNISLGEMIAQDIERETILVPFLLIHRDYKLTFFWN